MRSQEQEISATEKQRQALELRKAGVSYSTIAAKLGYKSVSGAHAAVGAALKKTLQEPADDFRKLELERLDIAHMAIWQQVKQGNQGAIDRFLKIAERRSKLLGLDAPVKQEVTGEITQKMDADQFAILQAKAKKTAIVLEQDATVAWHPDMKPDED